MSNTLSNDVNHLNHQTTMSEMSENTTTQNTLNQDELEKVIAGILEIPNSAAWTVVDSDPEHDLHVIHHRPEANLVEYGHLRGIVVDTQARCVVSRPYSHTPIVQVDKLHPLDDGTLTLTDTDQVQHSLNLSECRVTQGFEGPLITVFKHKGKVYRTIRKRLDPTRSRWGASKPFMEMYWDLGGPTDEQLYDPECQTSPVVHTFILVHPDALVVSNNQIDNGYIVYVGSKVEWDPTAADCPYPETEITNWDTSDVSFPTQPASGNPVTGTIYTPTDLDLNGINQHLKYGFHTPVPTWDDLDDRMLPGEFVIVYHGDQLIRIESESYAWRSGMRDNNPNLLHRFYQLVSDSYARCDTTEGRQKYEKKYPVFVPYSVESVQENLKEDGPSVVWPQQGRYHDAENLMTKESRMFNIWLAYLNSVPLSKQVLVSTFLDHLYRKRGQLIGWLRTLDTLPKLDGAIFSKRVINIVEVAQRFAQKKVKQGDVYDRNGRKQSVRDITRQNIKNLVMKEDGGSLYRLIREMDRYKKEQEAAKQ